ncbi:hypothetical protein [Brevibacillus massiliensis]|uniref:hypothetical protein n=1 Tax=Brevibacillus massiliensis TaxID=1118054 RepID=UPI0002E772D3|nr:hypothetical protein [Brevibacillus massiliensis]
MNVSDCCGAATKVEHRPDHPFFYDDLYDLKIPVLVCTKCGKVLGLTPDKPREDENL